MLAFIVNMTLQFVNRPIKKAFRIYSESFFCVISCELIRLVFESLLVHGFVNEPQKG